MPSEITGWYDFSTGIFFSISTVRSTNGQSHCEKVSPSFLKPYSVFLHEKAENRNGQTNVEKEATGRW